MKQLFKGMILLNVILFSFDAWSVTYYVARNGRDTNSGISTSAPFLTFKKAVSVLRPGDTLYIRAGTWSEQIDLQAPNKSGTSSAWIKIAGYPGEQVILQPRYAGENGYGPIKARGNRGYLVFENMILDGSYLEKNNKWMIRDGNHHFTLRNLEIRNFKTSLLLIEGDSIQVINCKLHRSIRPGSYDYGIYIHHGSNILIHGNKIHDNSGGGLHLYPGPLKNVTISNNHIYANNFVSNAVVGGIILYGGSSGGVIYNTKIFNNVIYRNGTPTGKAVPGISLAYNVDATKIWNNTIYGNKGGGINISTSSVKNTTVYNNISFGNLLYNYRNLGSGTIYKNNLTTDPKFLSASANDFRLITGSAAIDKGITLSEIKTDVLNVARPKGKAHDLGAFEKIP